MTQPLDGFTTEAKIRKAIEELGRIAGLGATSQADWDRFNARYASRPGTKPLPQRDPGKFADIPEWTMAPKHPWTPGHIDWIIGSLDKLGEALPAGEVAMTDEQTARLIIAAAVVAGQAATYLDDGKPHVALFKQRGAEVTEATNSGP